MSERKRERMHESRITMRKEIGDMNIKINTREKRILLDYEEKHFRC